MCRLWGTKPAAMLAMSLLSIRQHQPAVRIEHGMPPNLSYQNTWPSLRPQRRPEHERRHVCLYPKLSEWDLRHLCVSRSPGSSSQTIFGFLKKLFQSPWTRPLSILTHQSPTPPPPPSLSGGTWPSVFCWHTETNAAVTPRQSAKAHPHLPNPVTLKYYWTTSSKNLKCGYEGWHFLWSCLAFQQTFWLNDVSKHMMTWLDGSFEGLML